MIHLGSLFVFIWALVYQGTSGQSDGLHTMLNQLTHGSGADVQSLSYCRISTRDLIATAQSTASRVLQGVCNPRELNDRFITLEKQIADQFNVLKTMVLNIEDQLRTQDKQNKMNHGKLRKAIRNMCNGGRAMTRGAGGGGGGGVTGPLRREGDSVDEDDEDYPSEDPVEVDYGTDYGIPDDSPRLSEINGFNSTIHQEEGRLVFAYFWRIGDINYKMENWGWRRSLRSDSFYISNDGYRMYMRIYPNHRGENVYVHVGLTKGDYDDSLEWPFRLKHRVKILDHGSPAEDLTSRIWDPTQLCSGWNWRKPDGGDNYECVGLGFEQQDLRARNYIVADSIVIKLTVFLNA